MFSRRGGSLRRALKRGSARLLILKALSSRPMHGYDVAKEISALFGGGYEPSPGVVYPTLQRLEDQDFVAGTHENGKTIYEITAAGSDFLRENKEKLEMIMKFVSGSMRGDEFRLKRSAARLERTILVSLPEMSPERRAEVAKILDDASERISRLMDE
ncbi:MAG: PadR family transcriptional regulator [Thaumarchaeota archaeon]|nr:PadR family transcriptional regulator [Nitrososphaerota archaeon]